MNVEQILKMGGFPNTKKGIEAFYKAYPTKDSFMKKFGGVAFPQAPSADEFFSNTFAPNTPRGFYAEGGMTNEIAFPMQPPADYFFSAYPFTPEYQGGGTVSQVWTEVTGTPWSEAKKQGLTDGSFDNNIALLKRLQAGEFDKPSLKKDAKVSDKYKKLPAKKEAVKDSKENSTPIVFKTEEEYKKSLGLPLTKELKEAQIQWNIQKLSKAKDTKNVKQSPITYKSQEEYDAHINDPYSKEKRDAQIEWLNRNNAERQRQAKAGERRLPESGVVVDKRTNQLYYFGDQGQTGTFPVLTGKNVDVNSNPYDVDYLENHPELRGTPRGYYLMKTPEMDTEVRNFPLEGYGTWGNYATKHYQGKTRSLAPIEAWGMPAPKAGSLAFHRTYSDNAANPKDREYKRRESLYNKDPNMRCTSFGCVNVQNATYDEIYKAFPTSDTLMVLDSKNPDDARLLKIAQGRIRKMYGGLPGGANDMPCFECGGYMQMGGEEEGGSVSAFNYGQFPAIMENGGEDTYAKGGWIKKVSKSMEKRGTKGSFTKYCGGKVTDECIQRGLNSSNPLTRKRAGLAKAFRSMAKKQEGGDAGYGLDPNDVGKERSGYFMDILNRNRENANMDKMIDEAMQYEDYMNAAQMPMAQFGINQTRVNMPGGMNPYYGDFNWSMKDDMNYAKAQNNQMWGDYVSNQENKYNTGASFGNLASTYLMGMGAKQQYLKPKKTKSEILSGPLDLPDAPHPDEMPTDKMPTAQYGYQVPFSEQIEGMPYSRTIPQTPAKGPMAGAYPMLDRNNDGISDYSQDPNYVNAMSGPMDMQSINYMDQYRQQQIRDAEAKMQIQNPALAASSGNSGGKWWESLGRMMAQQQNQPGTQGAKTNTQTTTPGAQTTNQGTGQPSSGLTVAYGPITYGPQGWGKSRFRNYNEAYTAPQDVWASRVTKKRGIIPWNKTLTYEFWHSPTQRAQMQTQEKQDPAASNAVTNAATNAVNNTNPNNTAATNAAVAAVTGANNATNNTVTPGPGATNTPDRKPVKAGGGNPNAPADEGYERMEPINPLPGMIQQQRDQSIAEQEAKMQLTEPDPYFKTTNQFKLKTVDPYRADKMILGARFATNLLENRNLEPTRQIAQEKKFAEANRRGLEQGDNYKGIWEPNQGNINPYRVVAGTLGDTYTTQYGGMPSYVIPYAQYGGMPYDFYQMGGQYMDNDYGYMQEGGGMEDHVGYYTDEEIEEMRRNNPGMQIDFLD